MPFADPGSIDMRALFRDADMFESRRAWSEAGFRVIERSNNGKIMVAQHASVPGLLFKKYTSDVELEDQTKNYRRRVEGAQRLRQFVVDRTLSRVVVPRKWLLDLPREFSRREPSHVLAVEQLDLVSDEQTKATYQRIDPATLVELCTVVFHFRGMDSNTKNLPFVSDGRIAFIDTEHWDRGSSKVHLHHVGEYLSATSRALAKKIFSQLKDGDTVRVSDISGDFVNEDTSDSSDFNDEDDTSSSSSSS
jgi:hypothetical protein